MLTNFHVVGDAQEVTVNLHNGKSYDATYVGGDAINDVAVIKIDAPPEVLYPVTFGDSGELRVGMRVFAIGNPFGVGQTVTKGIVSATERSGMGIEDYENFIQTDAAINPGNSGGALVDINGRLIGINTAILSRSGGSQGVGFAVPSATARSVMQSLVAYGKVTRDHSNIIVCIVNLDYTWPQAGWVDVPVHEWGISADQPYMVHDLMTDERFTWRGTTNWVRLDPGVQAAHILRIEVPRY